MPERLLTIPHIQQKFDADCLVACAAMTLEAAGFRADYNRLRKLLGTSDIGTPHSRIQRLSGIHREIHIVYQTGELDTLERFVNSGYPVGIFVDTSELPYWQKATGHAVVVVGYSDQDFLVHDPVFRDFPQAVKRGDLQLAWQIFNSFLFVVQRK